MAGHAPLRRPASALRSFLDREASGGLLLMAAAAIAMIVANSPLDELYHHVLHAPVGPVLTPKLGPMTLHLWINDALMALFFLLVVSRSNASSSTATWRAGVSAACRSSPRRPA